MSGAVCCFTGHRNLSEDGKSQIRLHLLSVIEQLYQEGYKTFVSGAAMGFDTYAAEIVASIREKYSDIQLWLAIPFQGHDKGWPAAERAKLSAVSAMCDKTVILAERYYRGCYQIRDRWMVDHADACIAYYSGVSGGTAYTVAYAMKRGIRVENIYCDE